MDTFESLVRDLFRDGIVIKARAREMQSLIGYVLSRKHEQWMFIQAVESYLSLSILHINMVEII